MNTMRSVQTLLLCMTFIMTVMAFFTCPQIERHCTCMEETDWWLNEWTNVKVVNCSHRALIETPDLSSLRDKPFHKLLLNNNNITEINRNFFTNISVREIVLRKNPLKRIQNDAFQDLRDVLEILDVNSDRIKIDEGLPFLQGLSTLKVLDLGYNRLKNKYDILPSGLFVDLNLSSLTALTLQALQMTRLDDGAFSGIEHLEQLDLSFNFLSEFPSELLKLKNLEGLKLYSNELMTLKNNTFSGLTKLKKLLIGVNEITVESIEAGAFNDLNNSIEEINFYQNPLYKVPSEVLRNLKNLKKLSLVKTNLEFVGNGSFLGDYKLTELHLDDNPSVTFNDTGIFNGIEDSLEVLFIRTLNLEKLPLEVLRRLDNLYYLDITDNEIRKIDKHFFSGLKLSRIKLMWNKIKHVDHRAFRNFDKGIVLNLHNNEVRDISFILKTEECLFREIYLTANRIPCDCTVEKVLNSGLVSWEVFGDCYIETRAGKKWYSFSDASLKDYFEHYCNKTRPYAFCTQSTGGSSSNWQYCKTLSFYYCICLIMLELCCKFVLKVYSI